MSSYPEDLKKFKAYVSSLRRIRHVSWEDQHKLFCDLKRFFVERDAVAYQIYLNTCRIGCSDGPLASVLKKEGKYEAYKLLGFFSDISITQLSQPILHFDIPEVPTNNGRRYARDFRKQYGLPAMWVVSFAVKQESEVLGRKKEKARYAMKVMIQLYRELSWDACMMKIDNKPGWEKKWIDLERFLRSIGLSLTGEKIPVSYK